MTKDQSALVHKLATELNLKHESKGNRRRTILYIYKDQLNIPNQRNSQVISFALHNIASTTQPINQNALDIISTGASGNTSPDEGEKRKRGRPPKNAQT